MDFRLILEKLVMEFNDQGIDYALIGGVALGLLGLPRATMDIDFLIRKQDEPKLQKLMQTIGYELRYSSENVSQYRSAVSVLGEVDFLHAFRQHSLSMLGNARTLSAFKGALSIKVVRPEDLIGLKLQAINNDPRRRDQDLADIKALIGEYWDQLDWEAIRQYGELFDYSELIEQLQQGDWG